MLAWLFQMFFSNLAKHDDPKKAKVGKALQSGLQSAMQVKGMVNNHMATHHRSNGPGAGPTIRHE